MDVTLTPEQEALVQQGLANGRYGSPQDAAREAFALWERHQRRDLIIVPPEAFAADADPEIDWEKVRSALSVIPGSLSADFSAEREERF